MSVIEKIRGLYEHWFGDRRPYIVDENGVKYDLEEVERETFRDGLQESDLKRIIENGKE